MKIKRRRKRRRRRLEQIACLCILSCYVELIGDKSSVVVELSSSVFEGILIGVCFQLTCDMTHNLSAMPRQFVNLPNLINPAVHSE